MRATPTRSTLSPARRQLLDLMGDVGFGRIEGLIVQGGEPVSQPAPRIIREVKFAAGDPKRPPASDDFLLKEQVVSLFDELDRMQNGMIERLDVQHGLPFRMNIETAPHNPHRRT